MLRILKYLFFCFVLLMLILLAAFYYVNSDSFKSVLEARLSQELGNPISMSDFRLHSDGDITLKGLKVLANDNSPLLSITRVEVKVIWRDLLTKDYWPQDVRLFDADLDFKVKKNQWPLALLNAKGDLPPSPDFFAKIENLNLHLIKHKLQHKAYTVELDLLSAEVEKVPVISSLRAKGVVSEHALKFDSINLGVFSGEVESAVSVLLTQEQAVEEVVADATLTNIDLSEVGDFAKLSPAQILGSMKGKIQVGFSSKNPLLVDADLMTGSLAVTGPGVEQALSLLKKGEKTLSFNSSHIKMEASEASIDFTQLEFLNKAFISLYAPKTNILLDRNFQPKHIKLPLRLSAPYGVLKWRDFLMKSNPAFIEIPFDLDCDIKDLKTELINALIYTIQKHSLKKNIKRLEDKLGFKVDDQVIDVKKVMDNEVYKDLKQKVKKEVERIDRKQVDDMIEVFEKDDKKKKKLKKHIDLFMQLLQ